MAATVMTAESSIHHHSRLEKKKSARLLALWTDTNKVTKHYVNNFGLEQSYLEQKHDHPLFLRAFKALRVV